jgi:hypothetical protein
VDLSKNYNLRSLQVNINRFHPQRSTYFSSEADFAIHGIIPTIIAQIHPTAPLEYLAFGARAKGPKNDAFWLQIGYLMERAVFLALKQVVFDLYPAPIADFAKWERYIRAHMPDCNARDILRIRAGKE